MKAATATQADITTMVTISPSHARVEVWRGNMQNHQVLQASTVPAAIEAIEDTISADPIFATALAALRAAN